MRALSRPARHDELARLWPVVRSSYVVGSFEELRALQEQAPWQVRVTGEGDAMVLSVWRAHLDVLAIRGIWAPADRIPALVSDAAAVAVSRGLGRVMSPLVDERHEAAYRSAGMREFERLVGLSRAVGADAGAEVASGPCEGLSAVRDATVADIGACVALDETCFREIWRHGRAEVEQALSADHVAVVDGPNGEMAGYAVSSECGATVTIGRLAVSPEWRRRGVASALIAEATRWARGRGARGLSLCTQVDNVAARELYRRQGFTDAPGRYLLLMMDATPGPVD